MYRNKKLELMSLLPTLCVFEEVDEQKIPRDQIKAVKGPEKVPHQTDNIMLSQVDLYQQKDPS